MSIKKLYLEILNAPFNKSVLDIPKIIIILIMFLYMIACSNNSNGNSDFPPLEFNVNPDLLSLPLSIDKSFSIRMPSDWSEVKAESFNAVKKVINSDTSSFFRLELLKIFKSAQGASCVISKAVDEIYLFDLLNADFENGLKLNFQTEDVNKGVFSLNGNNTIQYRVINENIIVFKLFCHIINNFYQIDYFIPKRIYQEEICKVESSIGSITSNRNRKDNK